MYIDHKIISILQLIFFFTLITKILDKLYVYLLKQWCLWHLEVHFAQFPLMPITDVHRLQLLAEKKADIQFDVTFHSAKWEINWVMWYGKMAIALIATRRQKRNNFAYPTSVGSIQSGSQFLLQHDSDSVIRQL